MQDEGRTAATAAADRPPHVREAGGTGPGQQPHLRTDSQEEEHQQQQQQQQCGREDSTVRVPGQGDCKRFLLTQLRSGKSIVI